MQRMKILPKGIFKNDGQKMKILILPQQAFAEFFLLHDPIPSIKAYPHAPYMRRINRAHPELSPAILKQENSIHWRGCPPAWETSGPAPL